MTIEQFKTITKEQQNEFLAPFKNLKENISDYIVTDKIIEMTVCRSYLDT